jgi:hypothetical protein
MSKVKGTAAMPITYGTSYFVNMQAALSYYAEYGERDAVARKIREGGIHIGRPPLKSGETLSLIDGGRRYAVTEPQALIGEK